MKKIINKERWKRIFQFLIHDKWALLLIPILIWNYAIISTFILLLCVIILLGPDILLLDRLSVDLYGVFAAICTWGYVVRILLLKREKLNPSNFTSESLKMEEL